jgi:hypothetical protein
VSELADEERIALGLLVQRRDQPRGRDSQDLRSPDARDSAGTAQVPQDLRSPDARDSAAGRGTFSAPGVTVVKVPQVAPSAGGIDWRDAGIGAGAALGLTLLALGGTLALAHRKHAGPARREAATTR